jgi:uncharacterized protein YdcH (DUF465 family)
MFPEYRELISELKSENRYFLKLFDQHNALDQRIKLIEARLEPGTHDEIEIMKKQKLAIKDELYELLKRVSLERQTT